MVPSATFIENTSRTLEIVLDAELHDARGPRLRRDAAERARVEVQHRVAPVEVVEQVERLQAELQPLRAGNGDKLRQRQVDVPEVRTRPRRCAEGRPACPPPAARTPRG